MHKGIAKLPEVSLVAYPRIVYLHYLQPLFEGLVVVDDDITLLQCHGPVISKCPLSNTRGTISSCIELDPTVRQSVCSKVTCAFELDEDAIELIVVLNDVDCTAHCVRPGYI